MNGLDFALLREELTYRKLEDFNKQYSYFNVGILEFIPKGLKIKFKLSSAKILCYLSHYLTYSLGDYNG